MRVTTRMFEILACLWSPSRERLSPEAGSSYSNYSVHQSIRAHILAAFRLFTCQRAHNFPLVRAIRPDQGRRNNIDAPSFVNRVSRKNLIGIQLPITFTRIEASIVREVFSQRGEECRFRRSALQFKAPQPTHA